MLEPGTKIVKVNSKPEDAHRDGAKGVIKEAIPLPEEVLKDTILMIIEEYSKNPEMALPPDGFNLEGVYVVNWEDLPDVPVHIIDYRVKEDKNE